MSGCICAVFLFSIVSHETILFAMLHRRETVCCLPYFTGHLLVGLLHFGLRPVQQDRLRICPLQCRQRQQNISLTCAHKVILLYNYANIPINIVLTHKNERKQKFVPVSPQKKRKCNKSVTTACYNSIRTKETTVFLLILTKRKLKSGRKNYNFL